MHNPVRSLLERVRGLFTTVDLTGIMSWSGIAQRLTADFSGVSKANQLIVQTSATNSDTAFNIAPTGSGTTAKFYAIGSSSFVNYSFAAMSITATNAKIESGRAGTGTYLPLDFYTNNTKQLSLTTSGDAAINTTKKIFFDGVAATGNTYIYESASDVLDTYVGGVKSISSTITGTTIAGHPTLEGVTATGATGTGKLVFDTGPTIDITNAIGTGLNAKVGKISDGVNSYGMTGINTVSGTSPAVLSGLLPAGTATSTNQWLEVIIDSTSFWIPFWAK